MIFRDSLRAALLAAIGVMFIAGPASSNALKIGGTGAVTELLVQLAPAFQVETGIVLEVIPLLGSTGAINATAAGKLGAVFSGRDLTATEKSRGLGVATTLLTPFGFVTSRTSSENLKRIEIVELYRADKPVWPDGTPVLIHLRPVAESDNIVLGQLFPGMTEALGHLRTTRRDLTIAATDQDNADLAEKNNGSLAGASLTQIVTEARRLRFVSIEGVTPSLENYRNGSYPYVKKLYLIVSSMISPEAAAFIAFLEKPAVRELLKAAGVAVVK